MGTGREGKGGRGRGSRVGQERWVRRDLGRRVKGKGLSAPRYSGPKG